MTEKQNIIQPMELIDKTIGSRVWILLKNNKEFVGIFRGLDDYWNMVLDDAQEIEMTDEDRPNINSVQSILLNGNNIVMFVPGGNPTYQ